jgi:hypothetical protein
MAQKEVTIMPVEHPTQITFVEQTGWLQSASLKVGQQFSGADLQGFNFGIDIASWNYACERYFHRKYSLSNAPDDFAYLHRRPR